MNMYQSRKSLVSIGLAALLVSLSACGDTFDEVEFIPDPNIPPVATTFDVTIENVSTMGTISSDRAGGSVPLSPGAYAVFSDGDPDPLFTVGEMADSGTRLIAEDGFPSFPDGLAPPAAEGMTEIELLDAANVDYFGVFSSPGAGDIGPDTPAIFSGESASFTITASVGQRLQIETMFVQSNDWFMAFEEDGEQGIALFDDQGNPVSGTLDVDSLVVVYDAGTEVDTAPGTGPTMPPGPVQKPVQGPMAIDVGTDESVEIDDARERHDFDIPANSSVIQVTITPRT